uniref:Uncharacterized protein ycf23 n=1 Tax=Vertebrata thuyoides TaxID=2006970 RepID=A0A1Z1MB70_9FLOR|nr:hypothetical protein [Vertebrata thuyoides]ARW63065.1 hypothetical protein [Vertebrata thuyoides]
MKLFNKYLQEAFEAKSVLKVITGIDNINIHQVTKMAKAAELSNATYLDVSSNIKLIKFLKSFSSLPICVSSIDPVDIYNALSSGVDIIEIGNYDFLYNQGIYLSKKQIIELSKEIQCLANNIDICVTVPYYLSIYEQVSLAQDLKNLGINIIQTEGISKVHITDYPFNLIQSGSSFSNLHNSFIPSLFSAYIISQYVNVHIIASSGCKNIVGPISKFYGVSGIGIGSAVQEQDSILRMSKYIDETSKFLSGPSLVNSFTNTNNDLYQFFILNHKELLYT